MTYIIMKPLTGAFRAVGAIALAFSLVAVAGSSAAADVGERGIITLACGGFGSDESQRMLALEKAHALTIMFASADGSYVSGVRTRLEDPLSDLAIERDCGPIGLADVPIEGRYRLVATFDGQTRETWLELRPRGGARVVLTW